MCVKLIIFNFHNMSSFYLICNDGLKVFKNFDDSVSFTILVISIFVKL